MTNIWCASDHQDAMTSAKQGRAISDPKSCSTPIATHLSIGQSLGVRGTPAIFLSDGSQVGGYKTADELASDLGL